MGVSMPKMAKGAIPQLIMWMLLSPLLVKAQLSSPLAHDSQLQTSDPPNKFRERSADLDKDGDIQHEGPVANASRCGRLRLDLAWMAEATSSVYATPLITDLHADGRRDIIVPSFVHYLEVLEGPNGGQAVGWPAFHASSLHASPLLYDIDFDGVRDILIATYDGQILFFKDTGEKMFESIQIGRLRVRKDWYAGLDPNDPFDHTHPDVGDGPTANGSTTNGQRGQASRGKATTSTTTTTTTTPTSGNGGAGGGGAPRGGLEERVTKFVKQISEYRSKYGDAAADKLMDEARRTNALFYEAVQRQIGGAAGTAADVATAHGSGGGAAGAARRRLMAADDGGGEAATVEDEGAISDEAAASFDVFEEGQYGTLGNDELPYRYTDEHGSGRDAYGEGHGLQGRYDDDHPLFAGGDNDNDVDDTGHTGLAEDADVSGHGGRGGGGLFGFLSRLEYDEFGDLDATAEFRRGAAEGHEHGADPYAADPDELGTDHYKHLYLGDYVAGDRGRRGGPRPAAVGGWEQEDFLGLSHPDPAQGYVYIDPHIMTTPTIADIDGDGRDELVVAVSYFFDREYYDDPDHAKELGGIDIGKYVASGVSVFDLRTRTEKWSQHLDLSTDATQYKAYAYSSPTLADVDGDGALEIALGTSMGFLYLLGASGAPLEGWPVQMGEIQGQPLVADVDNDGTLEVIAVDMRGNCAAFRPSGEHAWERHVRSAVSQGAVAGDIDGDGQLEVVFGTASGHIYALAGSTGADIPNWPYRARGRIQSQPTLSPLLPGGGQQVLLSAFDGFLYVVDGLQGCADVADLGETSYAAVLVDDIDGDGALELVATTMNGGVYAFETGAPYHPLKTWTAQVMGPSGGVSRWGHAGIFALPDSRRARDVAGQSLEVAFEIVDRRVAFAPNGTLLPGGRGPYNVTVVLKGVGVAEMGSGASPVVGVADSFPGPGRYTVQLPAPRTQSSAVVRLEMVDASGLLTADEFALSFHMGWARLLKWALAAPLAAMAAGLWAMVGAGRTEA